MNDLGLFGVVLLAGFTFPLAFWIARLCLAGVMWVLEQGPERK
jgi:hypothetical protein